ncbi:hypothetical protein LTR12_010990 [Friedmanniomyces endolithicus]|nr:hypothetical protein LTR12_010990 [Friedmanniomyces endolithicus]
MDNLTLDERLTELQQRPKCHAWYSKLQAVCIAFWAACDTNTPPGPAVMTALATLLQDPDAMGVAQLVLTDLRLGAGELLGHARKDGILSATVEVRNTIRQASSATQGDFDSALYKAEKEVFWDAELHRLRCLLHQSEQFTSEEQQKLRLWLHQCPIRSLHPST